MPGLVVMVASGVRAQRYTPDWFDVSETCLHRDPCFSEQESAAVLRSSAWLGWAGLLMVLVGIGLCAWALSTRRRRTPSGRGAAVHAAVSGLVAAPAAALGLLVAWFGTFLGLGPVIVVIAWLALAAVVEALSRSLGRARGDRAAYLLSLAIALVGLVAMGATLAFLGWGGAQLVGALALSGLLVAALTALGDVAQDRHLPSWTPWAAAAVTGVAILGAALGGLGLLEPPTAWAPGTWSAVEADVPAPVATAPSPRAPGALPSPSPTPLPDPTPISVDAPRPCSPGDVTLAVGEFDFAMGARAASIRASNRSESACYLDGFATVTLLQGGKPLDLTVATTSSENPGQYVDGHATRVGIAPGHAARLVLYWRGYSQAADTMTPQTLEVSLEPGVAAVPLEVPEPRFDLVDGGEIRVGNWLPSTS